GLGAVVDVVQLVDHRVGWAGLDDRGPQHAGVVSVPGLAVAGGVPAEIAAHAEAVPCEPAGVLRGGDAAGHAVLGDGYCEQAGQVVDLGVGEAVALLALVLAGDRAAVGVQVGVGAAVQFLVLAEVAVAGVVAVRVRAARAFAGAVDVVGPYGGEVHGHADGLAPGQGAGLARVPPRDRGTSALHCGHERASLGMSEPPGGVAGGWGGGWLVVGGAVGGPVG